MSENFNLDVIWDHPDRGVAEKLFASLLFFLTKWYVWVGIVFLVIAIFAGSGENAKISDTFRVVSEGYDDSYGVVYKATLKNVSDETFNGMFYVKVICNDGTTVRNTVQVYNMAPGETQKVTIHNGRNDAYNVSSWSFVDE